MLIWLFNCSVHVNVFSIDAPLNVKNLMRALGPVSKWKTFCNSLNIKVDQGFFGTYEDKQETMQYFLDNPHCQVSWKRVALQLYHHMEERALDNLFNFIKSPHGQLMSFSLVLRPVPCIH